MKISLIKGDDTVATKEFDDLEQGTNVINWDIPIYDDLIYWNGSSDNIAIQFSMKIKPVEGQWFSEDQEAVFGLYYSPTVNDGAVTSDDEHSEIRLPLNSSCMASCGGDLGDFATPGFTWIIGVVGLAMAAIVVPKSNGDE